MDQFRPSSVQMRQFVENVRRHNALLEHFKANMPKPKPEPWYASFWRGFCTPFRGLHALWIVGSGQGYVRRWEDDE